MISLGIFYDDWGNILETFFHPERNHGSGFELLYQDDHLVIVNKPSGLLVHKTNIDFRADKNMVYLLKRQLGKWVYPVHRLDKATSGAIIFAFDKGTASQLCEFFASKRIQKEYIALVRGYVKVNGHIDYPLKDLNRDGVMQDAQTYYERLKTFEHPLPVRPYDTARYSVIKLLPKTGRQHQIRRHLKHIFHPIVGDTCYGDGKHNLHCRNHFLCERLMLHASKLSFLHPHTHRPLEIEAQAPSSFQSVITALKPWCSATI